MSIPDFEAVMLPLLEAFADDQTHHMRDITRKLGDAFRLTEGERQQSLFTNRVEWARKQLKWAELLNNTEQDIVSITDRGRQVLSEHPLRIDLDFLTRFPEFVARRCEFEAAKRRPEVTVQEYEIDEKRIVAQIEELYQEVKKLKSNLPEPAKSETRVNARRLMEELCRSLFAAWRNSGWVTIRTWQGITFTYAETDLTRRIQRTLAECGKVVAQQEAQAKALADVERAERLAESESRWVREEEIRRKYETPPPRRWVD